MLKLLGVSFAQNVSLVCEVQRDFIEMRMQEENGEGVLGVINFSLGIDG